MEGFIYFLKSEEIGSIKIGFSREPDRRLDALGRMNGGSLKLLGRAPGNQTQERDIHKLLKPHRLHGEWFRAHEEVKDLIEVILKHGMQDAGFDRTPERPRPSSHTEYVEEAKLLAEIICRNSGVTGAGTELIDVEKRLELKPGTLWNLKYRPPKRLFMDTYIDLVIAARRATQERAHAVERDTAVIEELVDRRKLDPVLSKAGPDRAADRAAVRAAAALAPAPEDEA